MLCLSDLKNTKIVIATGNAHKAEELGAILGKYLPGVAVVTMRDAGICEDIEENGASFEENAMIKARVVAAHGFIGIGDDSGLTVDALGGAPGIFSARYAGEHGNDKKNNAKLLSELSGIENRDAAFVCAIACAFPESLGAENFTVRGECRGSIIETERGQGGFGYDPLFSVDGYGKTFAELLPEEKNAISHRARAGEKLAERLSAIFFGG